jgi:lactate dehydrogenase-like 2-hydroxyacid dehydrogenase
MCSSKRNLRLDDHICLTYVNDNNLYAAAGVNYDKPNILQVDYYPDWDQELLDVVFNMHKYSKANDKAAFLANIGPSIKGIATRGELGTTQTILNACPNIEIVSIYDVGNDAVDVTTCSARGIHVTNIPDVLTNDVAEFGVAMMLAQSPSMIGATKWVHDGSWGTKGLYPLQSRVWGKRVGILGLGRIGFEVAKRLAGFNLNIAYSDVSAMSYALDWTFTPDKI